MISGETKKVPDNEFEVEQSNIVAGNFKTYFISLYRRTFLFKANTDGWWEDIIDSSEGKPYCGLREVIRKKKNESMEFV